jgi:hypothetical protein
MGGIRVRCADCHGLDGRGCARPRHHQVWNAAEPTTGLFKTSVRRTGRKCRRSPRLARLIATLWQMLAYLKTLAAPRRPSRARHAENGRRYFARCARPAIRSTPPAAASVPICRRIGSARSRDVLLARIPPRLGRFSRRLRAGHGDDAGRRVDPGRQEERGSVLVQIMDTRERIQGYEKDKVKSVDTARNRRCPSSDPID